MKASKLAQKPGTPPHVFYAPWRPAEPLSTLGVQRRIADLAFAMRDFPRADKLFADLQSAATKTRDVEILSWAKMQRARLLYITGTTQDQIKQSVKDLSVFLTSSPYKESRCAAFAILRGGLLTYNVLKDRQQAISMLTACSEKHRGTSEAEQSEYYIGIIYYFDEMYPDAIKQFTAYLNQFPKNSKSPYIKDQLIPKIEKEQTDKKNSKATASK